MKALGAYRQALTNKSSKRRTNMLDLAKRLIVTTTFIIWITSVAFSQQAAKCSVGNLNGGYGFSLSGFHAGIGNYALVGTIKVDGKGEVKGAGTQSINGDQADVSFTGTYTMDNDCTGVADLVFEDKEKAKVRFIAVSDGNEVLLMDVGGHTVETGYAKKLFTAAGTAK
jgi:hypothetical protein